MCSNQHSNLLLQYCCHIFVQKMASRFLGRIDFPVPAIDDQKPDEGRGNPLLRNTSVGAVAAQAFASTAGTFKPSFMAGDINMDNEAAHVNSSMASAAASSYAGLDMPNCVAATSAGGSSVKGPFFVAETSDHRSSDSGSAVSGPTHVALAASASAAAGGAGGAANVTIYNYMPPSDDAKAQWRQPPVASSPPPARSEQKSRGKGTAEQSEKLQRKANQTAIQISQAALRMSKIYQQLAINDDTRTPPPKMHKLRAQAEAKHQEPENQEEVDAEILKSLADVIENKNEGKEPEVEGLQGKGPQVEGPQVEGPKDGDKQQKATRKGPAKSSKKRYQPERKAQQAADHEKKDNMVGLAASAVPEDKQPDTVELVEPIAAEVKESLQVVEPIASEPAADVELADGSGADADSEASVEAIVKDEQELGESDAEAAIEATVRDQEAEDADFEAMKEGPRSAVPEAEGNVRRARRRPPGSVGICRPKATKRPKEA